MKISLVLVALMVVSACGADDPPLRPQSAVGLSVGSGGVTPSASVGATNGTFSVGLGL